MRVSIEKGFHSAIEDLMKDLRTDDPKIAVHHVLGCWFLSQSCSGRVPAATASQVQPASTGSFSDDEYANLVEF